MKPYTDMMMDLETLDTATGAVILQVGWVFFDRENQGRTMFSRGWYPDLEEQKQMGFTISLDTVNWWTTQNAEEWRVQMSADRMSADLIVNEMQQVWQGAGNERTQVWAKGTHFDYPIYRKLFPEFWSFRNIQDLRTLKLAADTRYIDYDAGITNSRPHDAVADAEAQAKEVALICSMISLDD